MKIEKLEQVVEVPEGTTASVANNGVAIKGKKGEMHRKFSDPKVEINMAGKNIALHAKNATRREKKRIFSYVVHIKNMIKGVNEGHLYKLKICSGHFPMNVSISGEQFSVKNFLGEKIPRVLKIKKGAAVKVEGTDVTVESVDKEIAGQTAADIEKLTTIKGRDLRIFQDGIYIVEKSGKAIE